jgi:hypothetical protein
MSTAPHRRGRLRIILTKDGLGNILGVVSRPLGDFSQKYLVALMLTDN